MLRILANLDEDEFYRPDAAVQGWARLAGAAQSKAAALTDAGLARVLSELTGRDVGPIGTKLPARLRGVAPEQVYRRVPEQYRYARSVGQGQEQAFAAAETRLKLLISDDLRLAERETTKQIYVAAKVSGYRRIVHPELSKGGTCGLCIAASDRVYGRAELLPLHTRCECSTLPILGRLDPGRNLNADEIGDLYRRAGGTDRQNLTRVRYTIHHHGELGPVLRAEGEHFTGQTAAEDRGE